MTKALTLAVALLGVLTPGAWAFDWRIGSRLVESVEANNNRAVAVTPRGDSYSSVSTLLFDAVARNPTSTFTLNGDVTYSALAGSAEKGSVPTLGKGVSASVANSQKLTSYNASASFREVDTASLQLAENGVITRGGTTSITTVSGGMNHRFSPRDSVSLSVTRSTTSSTSSQSSSSNESLSTSVNWSHQANELTVFSPSLSVQLLDYNDAARTQVTFVSGQLGMSTRLTKLVSISGGIGGVWVNNESNAVVMPAATTANPANLRGGTGADWTGNFQMSYALKQIRMSVFAARSTGPNTLGDFSAGKSVGMSMSYTVDPFSNVSMTANFSQSASTGGASESYTGILAYSRILAREWRTQLSYRFVLRNSGGSATAPASTSAQSHSVLLMISRDVTILP